MGLPATDTRFMIKCPFQSSPHVTVLDLVFAYHHIFETALMMLQVRMLKQLTIVLLMRKTIPDAFVCSYESEEALHLCRTSCSIFRSRVTISCGR